MPTAFSVRDSVLERKKGKKRKRARVDHHHLCANDSPGRKKNMVWMSLVVLDGGRKKGLRRSIGRSHPDN